MFLPFSVVVIKILLKVNWKRLQKQLALCQTIWFNSIITNRLVSKGLLIYTHIYIHICMYQIRFQTHSLKTITKQQSAAACGHLLDTLSLLKVRKCHWRFNIKARHIQIIRNKNLKCNNISCKSNMHAYIYTHTHL